MTIYISYISSKEATAILASMNYFDSISEGGIRLLECGLLPFEAQDETYRAKYIWNNNNTIDTTTNDTCNQKNSLSKSLKNNNIKTSSSTSSSISTHSAITQQQSSLQPILKNITHVSSTITDSHHDTFRDLLLGASPDGLLLHSDGSTEILEIKCVSPFQSNINNTSSSRSRKYKSHKPSNSHVYLTVTDRLPPSGVPAWHIPQLQLEILCAGPKVSQIE